GADRRTPGFFERAAGGTLFLDEIGETPDAVQPLLLRALESGEVQSVGGAAPRRHDVRLIAATDADLEEQMASGRFRTPLLHRLAGFEIRVPALRDRRGDFGRLLFRFLGQELERLAVPWPSESPERPWPPAGLVARLAALDWPGNIRQLRNVARRLAISHATGTELKLDGVLGGPPQTAATRGSKAAGASPAGSGSRGAELDASAAGFAVGLGSEPPPTEVEPPPGWRRAFRKPSAVGDDEVLEALRAHEFQLKASAEALGLSRASLYQRVDSMPQIRKASELEEDDIRNAMAAGGGDWRRAARLLEVSVFALKRQVKALRLSLKSDGGPTR
ncbi:MAG: sigma 54-interacting transcriptional regulator, partial [Acidobacteriota bacterium]